MLKNNSLQALDAYMTLCKLACSATLNGMYSLLVKTHLEYSVQWTAENARFHMNASTRILTEKDLSLNGRNPKNLTIPELKR